MDNKGVEENDKKMKKLKTVRNSSLKISIKQGNYRNTDIQKILQGRFFFNLKRIKIWIPTNYERILKVMCYRLGKLSAKRMKILVQAEKST